MDTDDRNGNSGGAGRSGDPASGKGAYSPGNLRDDGSYRVGKGRPPEHSRFRKGDDRPRGRRPKGQRNFDTEFQQEGNRLITVRENGKDRRVSKTLGSIIRAFDSASAKGDPRALSLVFAHASRIGEKQAPHAKDLPGEDEQELDAWIQQRLASINESEPELASDPDAPAAPSSPDGGGDDQ